MDTGWRISQYSGRKFINPVRRLRGVFYGWWLVGIAALIMALAIVPLFQGMTAWFVVLKREFSWSAGQMSWAFALARIEGGLLGPMEGFLVDRLGSRRMALIGMLIVGGGFVLLGRVQELWHLYGAFAIMALGAGLGGWLPMATMVNNWFVRRRSMAIALAMEGHRLGAALVVPALAWAIDPDADHIGWRTTATSLGVFIILLAFPITRLVRNRPEDYGQFPDGDEPNPVSVPAGHAEPLQSTTQVAGFTLKEAMRTRAFWLISFGHAGVSCVVVTIAVHMGIMLEDRGLSLQTIAWVVATYQGVGAVFTIVGGYVGDRIPMRVATFVFAFIQSVAVVVLILAHTTRMAFLFGVIMGIGHGGRDPLTTAIRGVYFGRRAFASISGIAAVPLNILQFIIPLFAGYMFDFTGSYVIPFTTVAVISFIATFLFLLMGEPAPIPSPHRAVRIAMR